jgi:LPS export ABC transporter protein LptC
MAKFLKKHWPLIGIGVVLIVVALYLTRAYYEIIEVPFLAGIGSEEEGLKLKNIHYTQNDPDEGMKWILDAMEVKFSKDMKFFSFKDFRLRLEPEERPSIDLEGKMGDYNKNTGEINLHGNLRGNTANGYSIFTQHILYKQNDGYLETEEPVKIFGPSFSLAGRGLYFNPEKEILRIISDVTTRIDGESLIL